MPTLDFNHVRKDYGATPVITDFTASIDDNEFLVLLGPSGCGKSTLLRMIAGLVDTSGGSISFDGQDMVGKDPRQRNVAFVFQSYALYPHMTVRANLGFPLAMDRFRWWNQFPVVNALSVRWLVRRPEIAARIDEVSTMLALGDLLDRRPKDLSGGQRQRVALARALVRDPRLFLLDEPLSNLDAQLRSSMRSEIAGLYQRVKKTFVYVTHDQVEAMTMGTRVIILNKGVIQQIGTPQEIYERPANVFVAGFIGAPPMNILPATVLADPGSSDALVGIRPEHLRLSTDPAAAGMRTRITSIEDLGSSWVYAFELGGTPVHATSNTKLSLFTGEEATVTFDPADALRFDAGTGLLLKP